MVEQKNTSKPKTPAKSNFSHKKPTKPGKPKSNAKPGGSKPNKFAPKTGEEEVTRVRLPRGREVIGILDQRVGGSRMKVRCMDGKTRLCRIPGKLKRRLWTREGDVLIIEPWEFGGEDKGDVVFKYRPNHIPFLKKKGVLDLDTEYEEF